ncbi:MAG: hypothetical protein CMF55_06125 [Legionellales bacterium]|nr:hypothetical protein [Legionellales bacterium]
MKYVLAALVPGCLIGGITIASGDPYKGTRDGTDTQHKANVDPCNKNESWMCGGALDRSDPKIENHPLIP